MSILEELLNDLRTKQVSSLYTHDDSHIVLEYYDFHDSSIIDKKVWTFRLLPFPIDSIFAKIEINVMEYLPYFGHSSYFNPEGNDIDNVGKVRETQVSRKWAKENLLPLIEDILEDTLNEKWYADSLD